MLHPMTVKCTRCHLVSARNRRINRLSVNDNMFFYPEIRDENSRLGQRCLAQDARIKSVLAFAITGLHSQRYLEHTTILPLDFANHWLWHSSIGHQLREYTGCDRFISVNEYWMNCIYIFCWRRPSDHLWIPITA